MSFKKLVNLFKIWPHKQKQPNKRSIKPWPSRKRFAKKAKEEETQFDEHELNIANKEFNKYKSEYISKINTISKCMIKRLSLSNLTITNTQIVGNLHEMKQLTNRFADNLIDTSEFHAEGNNPNYASLSDHQIEALIKACMRTLTVNLLFNGQNLYSSTKAKDNIKNEINSLNKKSRQELFPDKIKKLKDKKANWTHVLYSIEPNSVYALSSPRHTKKLQAQDIINIIKKFDKRVKSSMSMLYKLTMMG